MRTRLDRIALASTIALATAACGGGDATTTAGAGGAAGATSSTSGTGPGQGGAGGYGGAQGAGGAVGTGGAPALAPAGGVTIAQIALYQGPKRALLGGAPSPSGVDVPVVAGRDALVRVFVEAGPAHDGGPVTARVAFADGGPPIDVTGPVVAGVEGDLATTLNLEVPGARLAQGARAHVELLVPPERAGGDASGARWPATGDELLGVASDGPSLKLVLVPILYGGDGSDRAPDTSPAQLDGYRALFRSMYPIATLDLTVREPFSYGGSVKSWGWGWDSLLNAIADLRDEDGAADDVYYYGVFQPADTFDDYCLVSCTTGNGQLGAPDAPQWRSAIGLGFAGADHWGTAIHEIGHTQGRMHAPCGGANDTDPDYPYDEAGIGTWFYDLVAKQLVAPDVGKDLMGYCDPYTASDYTFRGIFDEMRVVSGAKKVVAPAGAPRRWERAWVRGDGTVELLRPTRRAGSAKAAPLRLTVRTARGEREVEARFSPYSHVPGGVATWPAGDAPAIAVRR